MLAHYNLYSSSPTVLTVALWPSCPLFFSFFFFIKSSFRVIPWSSRRSPSIEHYPITFNTYIYISLFFPNFDDNVVANCPLFIHYPITFNTYIPLLPSFDGRVVAKLPFMPIGILQNLSHRNLVGDDYFDCSFIFVYILCTMSIRQVGTRTKSREASFPFSLFFFFFFGGGTIFSVYAK